MPTTLHRVSTTTDFQPVIANSRGIRIRATKLVASNGDEVTLKPNLPPEFNNYRGLKGKWMGQVGDYSHVFFEGLGTVTIKSAFLVVTKDQLRKDDEEKKVVETKTDKKIEAKSVKSEKPRDLPAVQGHQEG